MLDSLTGGSVTFFVTLSGFEMVSSFSKKKHYLIKKILQFIQINYESFS